MSVNHEVFYFLITDSKILSYVAVNNSQSKMPTVKISSELNACQVNTYVWVLPVSIGTTVD